MAVPQVPGRRRRISGLVVVANALTLPVAVYGARWWLSQFAFPAPLGIGLFLGTLLLTVSAALLTVSWQAAKVARSEPAECLQHE